MAKKKGGRAVAISISLPEEEARELRERAVREGRTVSMLVRSALRLEKQARAEKGKDRT